MGKGDDTREAILEQATGLASRVGLHGLTIGSLAAQSPRRGPFAVGKHNVTPHHRHEH